mgnify:CR=1 FL=1
MILPAFTSSSILCAHQPEIRAIAKMAVKKFFWKPKHTVHKTTVEIHIRTQRFKQLAFLRDRISCEFSLPVHTVQTLLLCLFPLTVPLHISSRSQPLGQTKYRPHVPFHRSNHCGQKTFPSNIASRYFRISFSSSQSLICPLISSNIS